MAPIPGWSFCATFRFFVQDGLIVQSPAAGARALADRRDAQNRMAIRRGDALAHTRVTRVRIEEQEG